MTRLEFASPRNGSIFEKTLWPTPRNGSIFEKTLWPTVVSAIETAVSGPMNQFSDGRDNDESLVLLSFYARASCFTIWLAFSIPIENSLRLQAGTKTFSNGVGKIRLYISDVRFQVGICPPPPPHTKIRLKCKLLMNNLNFGFKLVICAPSANQIKNELFMEKVDSGSDLL